MNGNGTISEVLQINPLVSNEMKKAIIQWGKMYEGKPAWLHKPDADSPINIISLGLPAAIASEKARTVTLEMKSEITTPTETVEVENPEYKGEPTVLDNGDQVIQYPEPQYIKEDKPITDTARAEFLNEQYQEGVLSVIRRQLEYAVAYGGMAITPYVVWEENPEDEDNPKPKFAFDFTQADSFIPLAFDSTGRITDGAFLMFKETADCMYIKVERQTYSDGILKIENRAFRNNNVENVRSSLSIYDTPLGDEISLKEVPEWAGLQPVTEWKGVDRVFFAYFKMPQANTIDTHSPLGVSGYARAVDLIKMADIQHARLDWEYQASQMMIDVDREIFTEIKNEDGTYKTVLPELQERMFRLGDYGDETKYDVFAPTLRDASYLAGLNNLLMRIEDACAISRGTLSDANETVRTATELKILKQRTFAENADIQQSLQRTLEDVVYIMNAYCSIYNLVGDSPVGEDGKINMSKAGQYEVSFEWDDSIIVDRETELQQRLRLMDEGILSKVENRMWWCGETENQAVAALQEIEKTNFDSAMNKINSRFGE